MKNLFNYMRSTQRDGILLQVSCMTETKINAYIAIDGSLKWAPRKKFGRLMKTKQS